jgi:BlaI family transcriptional regulator, penicillinase repressor
LLFLVDRMPELPLPSDFELAILRVLWERGEATVRQVFEHLKKNRKLGYNTVLKTMLILLGKGLVQRNDAQRSHVYRATLPEEKTQALLLRSMLDKAFGGSVRKLVLTALGESSLSPREAEEIRDFSALRARTANPGDARRHRRLPVEKWVEFCAAGGQIQRTRALNISLSGMLLSDQGALAAGSPCRVQLPVARGGDVIMAEGAIARSDRNGTAIQFRHHLNPKDLGKIVPLVPRGTDFEDLGSYEFIENL